MGEEVYKTLFPEEEIHYCEKMTLSAIHYAARFAVKESFVKKAMGVGYAGGLHMKNIETIHNDQGGPILKLCEKNKGMVDERKIRNIHVTISHTKKYAVAYFVLEMQWGDAGR